MSKVSVSCRKSSPGLVLLMVNLASFGAMRVCKPASISEKG